MTRFYTFSEDCASERLAAAAPYCQMIGMTKQSRNWQAGIAKSREVRASRAKERDEEVFRALRYIARYYKPRTLRAYLEVIQETGIPTVSDRGSWSISLVHRYLKKMGKTAKQLTEEFQFKESIVEEYPAEIYARFRGKIQDVHEISLKNGKWVSALQRQPRKFQAVRHSSYGEGIFLEMTSANTFRCTFDDADSFVEVHPVDFEVFVFHMSVSSRQKAVTEFWENLRHEHQRRSAKEGKPAKVYRELNKKNWHL